MVAFSVRLSVDPEMLINPSIFDLGPVFSSVIDEGMNSGGRKDALPGFHHLCAFAVFAWFQQNDSRDAEIGNVPLPEHLEKASPLLRFVADAVEQVLEPGEWARATQLPSKPDRHALLTAVRSQLQKLRKSGAI